MLRVSRHGQRARFLKRERKKFIPGRKKREIVARKEKEIADNGLFSRCFYTV